MTGNVCKAKAPVRLAHGEELTGWAISFGTYDTMMKADMALRGRVLSPIGIGTRNAAGVVKLPEKAGFAAMMWNIPQAESLSLCTAYRAEGAHCDVMPPALVEQIAAYVKSTQPAVKPVAQGSESDSDDAPPALVPTQPKPKAKGKTRVKKTIPLKQKKKR
jgi:hypothetical protein